jgi:TP901 family phage tail tape measure protein
MSTNKRLNATVTIGGALSGSFKSMVGSAIGDLMGFGRSVDRLKEKQKELNREIKAQHANTTGPSRLNFELAEIDKRINKLKEMNRLIKVGKTQMIGGGVALGATSLAMAPAVASMKNAAEFNYQLQLIGNTGEMTDSAIKQLGQSIKTVGKQTGQSTDNMTKGMGFLIAAGMSVGTAQQMLSQIGKTATATGGEIEDIAKAAFTLNDSLKIAPGEAMMAALDTLAKAGKEGNVELKDLAKQLPVLGAGFVSLKMQGREAAATMGAALEIARKGAADADEAGNNMKNFIAKIMSPETLKKAKKHFNLDLYKIIKDAQSTGANPFEASMQAIIKATKGDQKAIGELFQDMQVQNFLRPMIQNWDKYKEIKDKSLSANGVVDKDFVRIQGTAKQQMNELGSSFDRVSKTLGTTMEPALGTVTGGLGSALDVVEKFTNSHPNLTRNLLVVGGTLAGATAALSAVSIGAGLARFAFGMLGKTMMLSPIGLIVTGLALGAALLIANWQPVKGFFIGMWDGITGSFKTSYEWIMGKLAGIGEAYRQVKAALGFGDEIPASQQARQNTPPAAVLPAGMAGLPSIPPMATSKGGVVQNINAPVTLTVHQLPGQDSKAFADDIIRRMAEKQSVNNRSMMFDHAMGY